MNNFIQKQLLVTFTMLIAITSQGIVLAGENDINMKWVLTGDSPLLDRSSKFMSNGYTKAVSNMLIGHCSVASQIS